MKNPTICAALAAVLLTVSACSGSGGSSESATETQEATTTTESALGNESEPKPDAEPEGEAAAEGDDADASSWWPAPATPFVEGSAVNIAGLGLTAHDGDLFLAGVVDLIRYDLDTGERTATMIPQGDDPWTTAFGLISNGDHLLVSAIADMSKTGLDIGATFDSDLNRIAFLDLGGDTPPNGAPHGSYWPDHGFAPGGLVTTSSIENPNTWVIDPVTLEYVEALPFASFNSQVAHDGDVWWVIDADGTGGVFADDGTQLATLDIGQPIDWYQNDAIRIDDSEVWFADMAVPTLFRFDRSSYELVATIDLTAEFDADVRLVDFSTGGEYAIASVGDTQTGGYVLMRLNDDGSIRSVHQVAPTDLEYWEWRTFNAPEVEAVGDRVFVIESLHRMREVDVAALDQPSTEPFVADPGTPRPKSPDEQAAVAEVATKFGLGDDWSGDAYLRGDRAWVVMSQAVPGNTFSFAERIDGEWVKVGGAWP